MLLKTHEVAATGTNEVRHDSETKTSVNDFVDVMNIESHLVDR